MLIGIFLISILFGNVYGGSTTLYEGCYCARGDDDSGCLDDGSTNEIMCGYTKKWSYFEKTGIMDKYESAGSCPTTVQCCTGATSSQTSDYVAEGNEETLCSAVGLCGEDFAYHSGTMINDNAEANSPQTCSEACETTDNCAYWDYENSAEICRLRSDAGSGKQTASGYSYGQKNCIFESWSTFVSKGQARTSAAS